MTPPHVLEFGDTISRRAAARVRLYIGAGNKRYFSLDICVTAPLMVMDRESVYLRTDMNPPDDEFNKRLNTSILQRFGHVLAYHTYLILSER
jgi:hypothetical protein